jgi:5'-3' exonuclease
MGIKDLNQLIKKYSKENVFKEIPAKDFQGKIFAVDISIFICSFVLSNQETWFSRMTGFLLSFKKWDINVIIVFDGKNVPQEKLIERESRKSNQQKEKARLEKLQFFKERVMLHADDIIPEPLQDEFKDLFKHSKKNIESLNLRDPEDMIVYLQEQINKKEQTSEGIQPHHKEMTRQLVTYMGLRYIEAHGEAESLAESMAYHKMVDGIISRDTDSLVYGPNVLITNCEGNTFKCVYLKDILRNLEISMETFIDICICLGCDYNHRMKLVGPAKIYPALQKYKTIDEWKKDCPEKPFHELKYNRCREIFRPYSKKYLTRKCNIRQKEINIDGLNKLFQRANSRYDGNYVMSVLKGENPGQYLGNWESIIEDEP